MYITTEAMITAHVQVLQGWYNVYMNQAAAKLEIGTVYNESSKAADALVHQYASRAVTYRTQPSLKN